jgi:hypothetical protein
LCYNDVSPALEGASGAIVGRHGLCFPPARPSVVPRPRWVERLTADLRGPMTTWALAIGFTIALYRLRKPTRLSLKRETPGFARET